MPTAEQSSPHLHTKEGHHVLERLGKWIRNHKIKTAFLLLLLLIVAELATIPYLSIIALKSENPGTTALMEQRREEAGEEGRTFRITQTWVPLSRIPRRVSNAVIVAEDGMFWSHGGIDWFEVQESIEKNFDEMRAARGASTITQQLAKNLFLSTSKDPIRKLKEVVITLLLEHYLSKQRILELYLNIIEWGRGIFGVQAASQTYFGKSVDRLTVDEALRMAAVIPSPLRHRPDVDSRYVLRRSEIIRRRMMARNFLTESKASGNEEATTLSDNSTGESFDTLKGVDLRTTLKRMMKSDSGTAKEPSADDTTDRRRSY